MEKQKLTKEFINGLVQAAKIQQEKARSDYDKNQGVINLCNYILEQCDFFQEGNNGNTVCNSDSSESTPETEKV